jgi:septum formation protein
MKPADLPGAADGTPWIYLASQSPRRRELLAQWGVRSVLLLPDEQEDAEALEAPLPGERPRDYVRRVTRLKWRAAEQRRQRRGWPPGIVLCADTTVADGEQILGKPQDAADAQRMLRRLAGRAHQVLTAVVVGRGNRHWLRVSRSTVHFKPLDDDEIAAYVATGEPFGKAGAYGIQGKAALWARRITGSHTGIVGLPAYETAQLLRHAGLRLL